MKQNKILLSMIIIVLIIIIAISIVLAYLLKNQKEGTQSNTVNDYTNINSNNTSDSDLDISERPEMNDTTNSSVGETSEAQDEDKTHVISLFNRYKQSMLNSSGEVYNRLDATYKSKRFPTEEKFKEYVLYMSDYIEDWEISKYKKVTKGDYTQYIILQDNSNYLYVNEKSEQEYTYILDNHTIDTEEYMQQYDSASRQEKAKKNAEKIVDAINTYDYEYMYSKLDNGFKQKNFSTIEAFKKYFSENLYSAEDAVIENYSEEGEKSILDISIDDYENLKMEMKLLDNRDFVMVFSVQHFSATPT